MSICCPDRTVTLCVRVNGPMQTLTRMRPEQAIHTAIMFLLAADMLLAAQTVIERTSFSWGLSNLTSQGESTLLFFHANTLKWKHSGMHCGCDS